MSRGLLITSAGLSSRFSRSVGRDVLKITYHEGHPKDSLLGFQLRLAGNLGFSPIIIVIGYKSEEIRSFISEHFSHLDITLVENPKYREWGTCYSFALGAKEAQRQHVKDLIYMEGDLLVDEPAMRQLRDAGNNVVTANQELITGEASVAFYLDTQGKLHYVYDTEHKALCIPEPFSLLGNSGQVWRFGQTTRLYDIVEELDDTHLSGTNLVPIERYFQSVQPDSIKWVQFSRWVNCNTVQDYRKAVALMNEE